MGNRQSQEAVRECPFLPTLCYFEKKCLFSVNLLMLLKQTRMDEEASNDFVRCYPNIYTFFIFYDKNSNIRRE